MSRYMLLEREINKGIKIDERAGQVITNWSPNNVRRLILGPTHAIVQYYVTGGRYKKLVEVVNYSKEIKSDVEQIMSNPKQYTGLLQVLVAGRVCSSIEEIFICIPNYPSELLELDLNLGKLVSQGYGSIPEKLANRFVRLSHISKVNISIDKLASFINQSKASDVLLLDVLQEKGVPVQPVCVVHKEDWWRGTYLRGKIYTMDAEGEVLDRYFSKLIEKKTEEEKEEKLAEIDLKRVKDLIEKDINSVNSLCSRILATADLANEVFEKTSPIDRLEWSSLLGYDFMAKGIRRELFNPKSEIQDMTPRAREVDTPALVNTINKLNLDSKPINAFMGYIFTNIIPDVKPYQKERLNVENSFKEIKNLSFRIVSTQTNIVYASFVKYLLKTGVKNAQYHANKMNAGMLSGLVYTRTVIEYVNSVLRLENNEASQALKAIGATDIVVKDFTVPVKIEMMNKIMVEMLSLK